MKKKHYISPTLHCYTIRPCQLLNGSEKSMPWSGGRDDSSGDNSTEDSF